MHLVTILSVRMHVVTTISSFVREV